MFVDFNRVFKKKEQSPQTQIPSRYLDFLSKDLPDGMKYVLNSSGECVIDTGSESYSIGGLVPNPTPEQLKILGKNYTEHDLFDYMVNSQETVPLALKEPGHVLLNGERIAIDKLVVNPLDPIHYIDGSMFMAPHPFPAPFTISLGYKNYTRELSVKRIPNRSVHEKKLESIDDDPIKVCYTIDDKAQNMQFTISLRLKHAKTVYDIVSSISIYNAFMRGEGLINGESLSLESSFDESKLFDRNTLSFWEKVLAVETVLGQSFMIPEGDIPYEDICEVERLYQNLVKKNPTREVQTIDSLTGEWEFNGKAEELSDKEPVLFCFDATASIELFKEKFSLIMYLMIINAVIIEKKALKNSTKIVLGDASEEKRRYTSSMVFKSSDDKDAFINADREKVLKLFLEAKRPQDYLQQEKAAE